ncbi:hypothetical protein PHISCL_09732 [Aspergillus sclerotialis]|uniref:Uncharacterized protein n=1 Tax=Aspergillus sclerotialis TaxID=2070753 RepID=A0A3A2Z5G9_9EURO|nr:hypothetical protein PHISCL_09732 [Aspergillus sclerotialis]
MCIVSLDDSDACPCRRIVDRLLQRLANLQRTAGRESVDDPLEQLLNHVLYRSPTPPPTIRSAPMVQSPLSSVPTGVYKLLKGVSGGRRAKEKKEEEKGKEGEGQ